MRRFFRWYLNSRRGQITVRTPISFILGVIYCYVFAVLCNTIWGFIFRFWASKPEYEPVGSTILSLVLVFVVSPVVWFIGAVTTEIIAEVVVERNDQIS